MDRRGAKMFALLQIDGFVSGRNVWHSNAIQNLSDSQLRKQFRGAHVVVFDEMVQHARKMASLRHRLESQGILVSSICLIRRRSHFLEGEVHDPTIHPIDDLDEEEFSAAATFLSRLLARRDPPMDIDHVVISGTAEEMTVLEMIDALSDVGTCEMVWEADDLGTCNAFTLDRPRFFDLDRVQLPPGVRAVWDGPVKIRFYHDPSTARVVSSFIAFPSLFGGRDAWGSLLERTLVRNGALREEISDALSRFSQSPAESPELKLAYVDLCTDISVELASQALEAGVFRALHTKRLSTLSDGQMASVHGTQRGKALGRAIRAALRRDVCASLFSPTRRVPLSVGSRRDVNRIGTRHEARDALLAVVPLRWNLEEFSDKQSEPIAYAEIMDRTSPLDESTVSMAADYELDVGTVQPTQRVTFAGTEIRVSRCFWRGEYDGKHLQTFDDEVIRRTRVVCANALDRWLALRNSKDETELHVAKLFANLVHDWDDELPPIAMSWIPYKFGAVPNLPPPPDRYLLPVLVKSDCIAFHEKQVGSRRQKRYFPSQQVRWQTLFRPPLCPGSVTSRVKGLVKAYVAIQEECHTTREKSSAGDLSTFADPLVVLASARNEQTAYRCAQFEIAYWLQVGNEHFFPDLGDFVAMGGASGHNGLRIWISEFAKASRFLFEKINMYRHLPELRQQLCELFERRALDAGDIVLDSVDSTIRMANSFSESPYPIGLLEWAMGIIRPFTSLTRQLLTAAGLERDTRPDQDRFITRGDGSREEKGPEYYLEELIHNAPELKSQAPSLAMAIEEVKGASTVTESALNSLRAGFSAISRLLKREIPDLEHLAEFADRRQKHEGGLAKMGKDLLRFGQGYVLVADFYNFVHFISNAATIGLGNPLEVAERVQEWVTHATEDVVKVVGKEKITYVGFNSDTIVVAASGAADVFSIAVELCNKLKADTGAWDRDIATAAIYYLRLGIARFEEALSGPTSAIPAVLLAYKIAEGHRKPRGTLTITNAVYQALPGSAQAIFSAPFPCESTPNQGEVRIWSPDSGWSKDGSIVATGAV
jgi:hypothetical protein